MLSLCEELRSRGFAYYLQPGYMPVNVSPLGFPSYSEFTVLWNDDMADEPDFVFAQNS